MRALLISAAAAISLATTCTAAPSAAPPRITIAIGDNFFRPAEVVITPDTRVTWVNEGANTHTVTSSLFDSHMLLSGQRFEFSFARAGRYEIACDIHSNMAMAIEVRGVGR